MAIAKWSEELRTDVKEVDKQHQELIKLVNDLHDALLQGKGRQLVADAIGFLSSYVVDHFKMEEKLMLDRNYPGFISHKREHERFVQDFSRLAQEFDASANASYLAITLERSIVQWLVNHIMKVDKQMAAFLTSGHGGRVA